MILISIPYLQENTELHHYKDQSVNAVYKNVYSENIKTINTVYGQNKQSLNVKAGG
jgi:hypothetical protein